MIGVAKATPTQYDINPGSVAVHQCWSDGSIYEGGVMLISKISRAQMAVYLCIASNGVHPAVSRRVMVSVHFPPTLSIPNQLVGTHPGANATLLCTTEAYPRSLNYWTRVKRGVVSDVGHGRRYQVASLSTMYKKYMTLTIFRVVRADYGVYRCHASNSLGTTDGAIRLYDIKDPNGEQDETATEEAPETTPATGGRREPGRHTPGGAGFRVGRPTRLPDAPTRALSVTPDPAPPGFCSSLVISVRELFLHCPVASFCVQKDVLV
ncbi:lachesin [Caerostris darwini]|uniref:Lachesin n=1 Tax=Caerostris darwini TaxID=1538125 RepID=A0AAV4WLN2_9ARAC|nr:lachesin [Caerostris darwini]